MAGSGEPLMIAISRSLTLPNDGPTDETWHEPGADLPFWQLLDIDAGGGPGGGADGTWWVGRQLRPGRLRAARGAGAVMAMFQEPLPDHEDEFNEWMDTEHIPALGAVPGVLAARRYEALTGRPKYLGLYHLVDADVCSSVAWQTASDTPWRARIRPHTQHRSRHVLVTTTA